MTGRPDDFPALATDDSPDGDPANSMPAEEHWVGRSTPHDHAIDPPTTEGAPNAPGADAPTAGEAALDILSVESLAAVGTDHNLGADGDTDGAALTAISAALGELADHSRRYHTRAEQREKVIDGMHAELERLRRGERRGLVRPLLSEVCRLRDDLLRQADQLPADYDARRASELLRSYAESIEIMLADNGVTAYQPEPGDPFEARVHRGIRRQPTDDPGLVGTVARVSRSGYLDLESNVPIAAAEVVVFTAPSPESTPTARSPQPNGPNPARAAEPDDSIL